MADVQKGSIIAGKYRLEERLAGGGMGSIWRGHDLRLDAPVAVKFMLPELAEDPQLRARFEREAKASAQIRSPHVVHMYDHGIEDGTPYLVMEFLDGEDLRQRLKRTGPFPLGEARRICSEICKGLHRAHQLGIIHRDLKPGNVFLSAPDDDLAKVLDFGIAKASGVKTVPAETTTTGELLGSPHYMSPEQVRGGKLDARSDLWAVAVILYLIVTAKRPFGGSDVGDLCVKICTEPVEPPSTARPELGPRMDRFFERAFQRDRDERFQSAKELAAAFSAVVRSVPGAGPDEPGPGADSLGDEASSWESHASGSARRDGTSAAQALPVSLPTKRIGGDGEPTPYSSSHTLPGLPSRRRRRAMLGLAAGGLLLLVGGGLAAIALDSPDGEPTADSAASEVPESTSVESVAGVAESARPTDDSAAEVGTSSAAPSVATSAAVAGSSSVKPAAVRPRPSRGARKRPSRPSPQAAPAAESSQTSNSADTILGY